MSSEKCLPLQYANSWEKVEYSALFAKLLLRDITISRSYLCWGSPLALIQRAHGMFYKIFYQGLNWRWQEKFSFVEKFETYRWPFNIFICLVKAVVYLSLSMCSPTTSVMVQLFYRYHSKLNTLCDFIKVQYLHHYAGWF